MSNNKMKGLLKGLRYISQIFDNEKEEEIQIGFPTDVKHVAHIGWDGPSVNSPSWMTEFNSPQSFSSGPLKQNGHGSNKEDSSAKWNSQDSNSSMRSWRPPASPGRELPEKPRSSRLHLSSGSIESPTKAKTKVERSKHRRPKSTSQQRDSLELTKPSHLTQDGTESPSRKLSGVPKKSRRKKSKDGGSTRSRSKADQHEGEINELKNYASQYSDLGLEESESRSQNDQFPSIKSPLKLSGSYESGYI